MRKPVGLSTQFSTRTEKSDGKYSRVLFCANRASFCTKRQKSDGDGAQARRRGLTTTTEPATAVTGATPATGRHLCAGARAVLPVSATQAARVPTGKRAPLAASKRDPIAERRPTKRPRSTPQTANRRERATAHNPTPTASAPFLPTPTTKSRAERAASLTRAKGGFSARVAALSRSAIVGSHITRAPAPCLRVSGRTVRRRCRARTPTTTASFSVSRTRAVRTATTRSEAPVVALPPSSPSKSPTEINKLPFPLKYNEPAPTFTKVLRKIPFPSDFPPCSVRDERTATFGDKWQRGCGGRSQGRARLEAEAAAGQTVETHGPICRA